VTGLFNFIDQKNQKELEENKMSEVMVLKIGKKDIMDFLFDQIPSKKNFKITTWKCSLDEENVIFRLVDDTVDGPQPVDNVNDPQPNNVTLVVADSTIGGNSDFDAPEPSIGDIIDEQH
jgi:hypothetical protein